MLTYDELINGDDAFIKQLTRTSGGVVLSDTIYAHWLWQVFMEGKSPIALIKELGAEPVIKPVRPLRVNGVNFERLNSEGWWEAYKPVQYTSFLLFKKYLEGGNWYAVMDEMRMLGYDGPRFFLMCKNIADFNPSYSLYQLREFVAILNNAGQIPEVVVLADAQHKMPQHESQQSFLNAVCDALSTTTQLIELGNEWKQNGFDPLKFYRPPSASIISRGSGLSGEFPINPAWDYSTMHNRRDLPKAQLISRYIYFAMYGDPEGATPGTFGPVIDNEPLGAGETEIPGSRSANSGVFVNIGREVMFYGSGATFHYQNGLYSDLIKGTNQERCALAFIRNALRTV